MELENDTSTKYYIKNVWKTSLVVILIIIALVSLPYFFVNESWLYSLESDKAYKIGGAIGGLTAPILGIIIAIVTYLAFYVQVKANKQVTYDMKIGRIETQFYQMLQLHRENVRSFKYIAKDSTEADLYGREAFDRLRTIINVAYARSGKNDSREKITESYGAIFNGGKVLNFNNKGHAVEIAHYIRQLFHTVKFIAHNKDISSKQKHEYLRQLRAQMSTDEQILLFYNWYSGFGSEWQNQRNKFFSEYRLIHNIFPDRMPGDIKKLLLNKKIAGVEYGKNSQGNSIFEFQDWRNYISI